MKRQMPSLVWVLENVAEFSQEHSRHHGPRSASMGIVTGIKLKDSKRCSDNTKRRIELGFKVRHDRVLTSRIFVPKDFVCTTDR